MKKSFIFITIGLALLILSTLLEPTSKKYSDTGHTLLSIIWIPGVLLVLYGSGRLLVRVITWLVTADLRNRYNLISFISEFFKFKTDPRHNDSQKESTQNKSKGKYKNIIWGIAILWFVGSGISYIYTK